MQGSMSRTQQVNAFGNALGNDIAGRMQGSPKPKSNIPDGYTEEEWAKYQRMNQGITAIGNKVIAGGGPALDTDALIASIATDTAPMAAAKVEAANAAKGQALDAADLERDQMRQAKILGNSAKLNQQLTEIDQTSMDSHLNWLKFDR